MWKENAPDSLPTKSQEIALSSVALHVRHHQILPYNPSRFIGNHKRILRAEPSTKITVKYNINIAYVADLGKNLLIESDVMTTGTSDDRNSPEEFRDECYAVFGISRDATDAEVTEAYRQKMQHWLDPDNYIPGKRIDHADRALDLILHHRQSLDTLKLKYSFHKRYPEQRDLETFRDPEKFQAFLEKQKNEKFIPNQIEWKILNEGAFDQYFGERQNLTEESAKKVSVFKTIEQQLKKVNVSLYDILESSQSSTRNDIEAKYRHKSLIVHPSLVEAVDNFYKNTLRHSYLKQKFQYELVNEAWEILSDPKLKEKYDRTGSVAVYTPSHAWDDTTDETFRDDTLFRAFQRSRHSNNGDGRSDLNNLLQRSIEEATKTSQQPSSLPPKDNWLKERVVRIIRRQELAERSIKAVRAPNYQPQVRTTEISQENVPSSSQQQSSSGVLQPFSTRSSRLHWLQRPGLVLVGLAMSVSSFVGGYLGAYKAIQHRATETSQPVPEHIQTQPVTNDEIFHQAQLYRFTLESQQALGGAALANDPDASPEEKMIARATDALYQHIDQETGATEGSTRDLFNKAAKYRSPNESVFQQAEQNIQDTRQSVTPENAVMSIWNTTKNALSSLFFKEKSQKSDEQTLIAYMNQQNRQQS